MKSEDEIIAMTETEFNNYLKTFRTEFGWKKEAKRIRRRHHESHY